MKGLAEGRPSATCVRCSVFAVALSVAMIVGMIFVALMGFRALAGGYSSRQTDGLVAASIWWYAMTGIYFVLWIGVFIAK